MTVPCVYLHQSISLRADFGDCPYIKGTLVSWVGQDGYIVFLQRPYHHIRIDLFQLVLTAPEALVPEPVPDAVTAEQPVMISGYDEVEFLELLRRDVQSIAAFHDIGFHAHLHVELGILDIHPLDIVSHIDYFVPVDAVEQMTRPVVRNGDKLQLPVERLPDVILYRPLPMGICGMGM